jgi:hypothetical protein
MAYPKNVSHRLVNVTFYANTLHSAATIWRIAPLE